MLLKFNVWVQYWNDVFSSVYDFSLNIRYELSYYGCEIVIEILCSSARDYILFLIFVRVPNHDVWRMVTLFGLCHYADI